ncbi:RDD family protein [Mycobacterium sp. C31M]
MTHPPYPPGGFPPGQNIPPAGGCPPPGSHPPVGAGGFGPPPGVESTGAYTPWFTRVLAWLIDYVPVFLIVGIGFGVLAGTRETVCLTDTSEYDLGEFCATGASSIGQLSALGIFPLLALVFVVWNLGFKQGATGSSLGKSIMKFKIVGENNGQPIGFGLSLARELIYLVAYFACGIVWLAAVLFPLWDPKAQTLVDKLIKTVALPI